MTTIQPHTMTNSERKQWTICQHRWMMSYGLGLEPSTRSKALLFGRIWHSAMEAWWGNPDPLCRINSGKLAIGDGFQVLGAAISGSGFSVRSSYSIGYDQEWLDEARTLMLNMLEGYDREYGGSRTSAVLLNECRLHAPTRTHHGNPSPWARVSGQLDKLIVDEYGQQWVCDHKTTSAAPSRWRGSNDYDPQAATYAYLVAANYPNEAPPVGVCYDIVRKAVPAPVESFGILKSGKALKKRIPSHATPDRFLAALRLHRFNLGDQMWYRQTLAKLRAQEDGQFYCRVWVRFAEGEVGRVGKELYTVATQLRRAHRVMVPWREQIQRLHAAAASSTDWVRIAQGAAQDKGHLFPRSTTGCMAYNRPCPYMNACRYQGTEGFRALHVKETNADRS